MFLALCRYTQGTFLKIQVGGSEEELRKATLSTAAAKGVHDSRKRIPKVGGGGKASLLRTTGLQ